MPLEETLESLARLTEWPVAEVLRHSELGINPPLEVMEWLLSLAEQFENVFETRGVVIYLPDLYRECGSDLDRTKEALDKPPYSIYAPMELLLLGLIQPSVHLAQMVLDPGLIKEALENPFFDPEMPRHAINRTIHYFLDGTMGLVLAQRWEEHIAHCEGCRENAADITYLEMEL